MTVKLNNNFFLNARGIILQDSASITWAIDTTTNKITATGSGGAGTVTSVAAGASGDIVIGGTPTVAPTVDLSAGAIASLALANSSVQSVGSSNLTIGGTATAPTVSLSGTQVTNITLGGSSLQPIGGLSGSYTSVNMTLNASGQITAVSNGSVPVPFGQTSASFDFYAAEESWEDQQIPLTGTVWPNGALTVNGQFQVMGGVNVNGVWQQPTTPYPPFEEYAAELTWEDQQIPLTGTVWPNGPLTVNGAFSAQNNITVNGVPQQIITPSAGFAFYAAELSWEDQQIPLLGTVWPGGPLVVNGQISAWGPGEAVKIVGDGAFLNFRNTALTSVLQLGPLKGVVGGADVTDAAILSIGTLNFYSSGSATLKGTLATSGAWQIPISPLTSATTQMMTGLANFKSSLSTSANATLTADAALTVTCNETGWYDVEAYLVFFEATSGAGGFQFDFNAGGGTIANASFAVNGFSTAAFSNAAVTSISTATSIATIVTSSSAPSWCRVKGTIQVTVAGTFGIRWAQASILAIDPTTLTAGSKIVLTKIG